MDGSRLPREHEVGIADRVTISDGRSTWWVHHNADMEVFNCSILRFMTINALDFDPNRDIFIRMLQCGYDLVREDEFDDFEPEREEAEEEF